MPRPTRPPDPATSSAPRLVDLPPRDPRAGALARTVGVPDLLARVLLARGVDDPGLVRQHLRPELDALHDPFEFDAMQPAVDRVRRAVADGETILVHGDYDVDGISGTVLLLKLFAVMQAKAVPFIPQRSDGYSFSQASFDAVRAAGATLCISVDNGTNAIEWIDRIQRAGCDVIVTDHHGTTENVADAHCVLNPRLPDSGYPDRDLAGVGVAFSLASAVARSFSRGRTISSEFQSFLVDAMTYVALGTIADVAPLRGENRILVFHGLRALAMSRNPGIRALLDSANLSNRSPTTEDVAFRIAPLINAAGRMGSAVQAVELLMARGYQEAQEAAKVLEQHNKHRRQVERDLVDAVLEEAAGMDDRILVLGGEGWHPGVLGIVASRVAESLHKPTVLVAFDGERGRGSGRSGGTLHLRDALLACSDCLLAHGGHAAAVGLEIERQRMQEFRANINARCGSQVAPMPLPQPDGQATFDELDARSVRKLDLLGPFGAGCPRPTFVTDGVRVVGRPQVDGRGVDLRLKLAQGGCVLPARLTRGAGRFEELRAVRGPVRIAYSPRLATRAEEGPVHLQLFDLTVLDSPAKEPRP